MVKALLSAYFSRNISNRSFYRHFLRQNIFQSCHTPVSLKSLISKQTEVNNAFHTLYFSKAYGTDMIQILEKPQEVQKTRPMIFQFIKGKVREKQQVFQLTGKRIAVFRPLKLAPLQQYIRLQGLRFLTTFILPEGQFAERLSSIWSQGHIMWINHIIMKPLQTVIIQLSRMERCLNFVQRSWFLMFSFWRFQ